MLDFVRRQALFTFLALSFCGFTAAQVNTSAISGTVTDESGSIVPNVSITVTQESTGFARTTKTADNGEYTVAQLPPGRYTVKAAATGFQSAVASAINLDIAQRSRVDITMHVGNVTQEIEVTARAQLMDVDTASLAKTIERRTVQDCRKGRNYLTLGSLSPE